LTKRGEGNWSVAGKQADIPRFKPIIAAFLTPADGGP